MTCRNLSMLLYLFSFLTLLINFCCCSPFLMTVMAVLLLSFTISIRTSFQILACISLSWSDGHLGQLFPVSHLSLSINLHEKWDKLVYLNMYPLLCCDPP